ncbi:MAG: hypothetical protein QNJ94_06025 [Alphaproteobacteria bacterium]|nr:hypothetical protein [Alphaproteobacteria bacterium]
MADETGRRGTPPRILNTLVLAFAATMLAGQPVGAEERLNGAQLRELLPGKTVQGTSDGINDITVRFSSDGTVAGRAEMILLVDEDEGVWEIEDDTICLTWTTWADAERRCMHVERHGDRYESYAAEDGSMRTVFRVRQPSTQVGDTGDPLDDFYKISTEPMAFGR